MFGATVLVPILFHINPATVLLFNGIGTLLYLFICKGKIPAYLGSSFAFISPVLLLLPLGYEVALGVTQSSLAASFRLSSRAAASKQRNAFSGGSFMGMEPQLRK
ncbi:hypothetical protein JTM39_37110, partial [Pseudomonas aeruginosa]|nr:hypothetical protein [Pseudomonas aeruginosa]